ncbi:MAG: BrnT family toxin [Candidatus Acidiferrales bacterium]
MRFEWDETKSISNLRKHDVRFETAVLVFDDPYALTQRDSASEQEERWITIGSVGSGTVLLVVHTIRQTDGEETICIISARAAGSHERKAYEEAHEGTKTRHRRNRRKGGRGH